MWWLWWFPGALERREHWRLLEQARSRYERDYYERASRGDDIKIEITQFENGIEVTPTLQYLKDWNPRTLQS